MELLYCMFVIACFVDCNCTSQLINNYVQDPTVANMMCPADQIEFQKVTRSAVDCVATCDRTPGCTSLIYLHGNKTCFGIKSDNPFSTSSPLPGAVFYRPDGSSQVTTASPSVTTTMLTAESTSGSTGGEKTTSTTTETTTTTRTTAATMTELTTTTNPGTPMVIGVANSQLSASSYWSADPGYTASDAKLNNTVTCWSVENGYANTEQYIQVDFLHQIQATFVITKGDPVWIEWMTSYKVLTSTDCVSFAAVKDGFGNDMIFTGNIDEDSEAMNAIVPPVICRCFRINPRTWSDNISIRFEVLGHLV